MAGRLDLIFEDPFQPKSFCDSMILRFCIRSHLAFMLQPGTSPCPPPSEKKYGHSRVDASHPFLHLADSVDVDQGFTSPKCNGDTASFLQEVLTLNTGMSKTSPSWPGGHSLFFTHGQSQSVAVFIRANDSNPMFIPRGQGSCQTCVLLQKDWCECGARTHTIKVLHNAKSMEKEGLDQLRSRLAGDLVPWGCVCLLRNLLLKTEEALNSPVTAAWVGFLAGQRRKCLLDKPVMKCRGMKVPSHISAWPSNIFRKNL